jgi:hypothetical protein
MNVNVRRGMFRLWVVLSALYVVIVVAVSADDVIAEFKKPRSVPVNYDSFPNDWVTPDGKPAPSVHGPWEKDPVQSRQGGLFDDLIPPRDRYDLIPPRPWQLLLQTLAYALVPPAVLLIVGSALGWAFSGFRQPN